MSNARNLARVIVDSSGDIAANNLDNAVPADGSITAAKLAASLDLSSKTLTYPDNSVQSADIASMAASKLSGQVPNINLPPGTVLQVQVCNASVNTSATTQSSQTELNTAYRVSITPQRSNSLILLEYFVPMGANGSWSANWLVDYSAVRMPAGSALNTNISNISSVGDSNGARKRLSGAAVRSFNGYDLNDQLSWNLTALDYPATTSALQYGFTWGGEGSGPVIVGQSSSNDGTWAFSARVVIVATEIAV